MVSAFINHQVIKNITPRFEKHLLDGDIQFLKEWYYALKEEISLADSIKSGRYREQRYRLLQSYEGNNI